MNTSVAVVGCGYWGKNLVRVFHELGSLAAVCDTSTAIRDSVCQTYPGVRVTDRYEDVLTSENVRAVVIAAPAVQHYDLAKQALEQGKDVYVEKPLALHVAEGKELVEIARRNGRILMVGHILEYHPAIRELKRLIMDGQLGKIQYIYSSRLNIGKLRTEENILWSFAPHDIAVILSLLNEFPVSVTAQGGCYLNSNIADTTLSSCEFSSGAMAHVFVSWLHPFKEQRLCVIGDRAMAVFDDVEPLNKLVLYHHQVEWHDRIPVAKKNGGEPVPLPKLEPLKEECSHFLNCIRDRTTPVTDGESGLRVLQVLDCCEQSLRARGAPVRTVPQSPPYYVHPTAIVDQPCRIGNGTKIWHFSHILKGAEIGERCIVGQNCQVAEGVVIGNNVKVQNNVSIYTGTIIEDDVFLGPSCVLTNVTNPRSQVSRHSLYEPTVLRRGATVGANATIVCGVELGRYSFIAAGAVVTKNVPDYALMVGNPARQMGWISRHGHRLHAGAEIMVCPESGFRYQEVEPGVLHCLDLDEEAVLPKEMSVGRRNYDDFKAASASAQRTRTAEQSLTKSSTQPNADLSEEPALNLLVR
jgi:UDP-2-acetamido-3-amino-2,3-dideoxy-glucuronate N-acetyltransferase